MPLPPHLKVAALQSVPTPQGEDGSFLLAGHRRISTSQSSQRGILFEFEPATGAQRNYGNHPLRPERLFINPQGDAFYVADNAGRGLRVRLQPSGLEVTRLPGQVEQLTFDPNGRFLLWKTLGLVSEQTLDPLQRDWPSEPRRLRVPFASSSDLVPSPDGTLIAQNASGRISVSERTTSQSVYKGDHGKFMIDPAPGLVAVSPDNRLVAFAARPGRKLYPDQAEDSLLCVEIESGRVLWQQGTLGPAYGIQFLNASTLTWVRKNTLA
jgi:DNA-binding beta-propeller fold protein YncE